MEEVLTCDCGSQHWSIMWDYIECKSCGCKLIMGQYIRLDVRAFNSYLRSVKSLGPCAGVICVPPKSEEEERHNEL